MRSFDFSGRFGFVVCLSLSYSKNIYSGNCYILLKIGQNKDISQSKKGLGIWTTLFSDTFHCKISTNLCNEDNMKALSMGIAMGHERL